MRRVCRLSNSPGILLISNTTRGPHTSRTIAGQEGVVRPAYPDFSGNIFLMAGTPSRCTKKARTFSFTYEAWKKT